jgi:glycosyltransferase involved in cell wall biosynthesis
LISKQIFSLSSLINKDDWELIIVDDGSTDESEKVINRYKDMNIIKNFHYIKKIKKREKYGNCSMARNIGAKFGTGDYILFTDPEVMPLPDWAEQHYLAHKRKFISLTDDDWTDIDRLVYEHKVFAMPKGGIYKFDDVQEEDISTNRNVIGYCLQPRLYHVVSKEYGNKYSKECRGPLLGDAYTDYNWFDIVGTWKVMEDKIKQIQKEYGLTDRQVLDEFYIYQATQAGHSVSRKLFYEIGGFEEDYANSDIGLDKWAGEDTWFRYCLMRFGSPTIELEKARAIHIYHTKECSNCDAVSYASKYAVDYPNKCHANLNRDWGLVSDNGFHVVF